MASRAPKQQCSGLRNQNLEALDNVKNSGGSRRRRGGEIAWFRSRSAQTQILQSALDCSSQPQQQPEKRQQLFSTTVVGVVVVAVATVVVQQQQQGQQLCTLPSSAGSDMYGKRGTQNHA